MRVNDTQLALANRTDIDVRAAILGGLAGACLSTLAVLFVVDWLTGLHNAPLSLGLVCAAILLAIFAVARVEMGDVHQVRRLDLPGVGD